MKTMLNHPDLACPICNAPGIPIRARLGSEILKKYKDHVGVELSEDVVSNHFKEIYVQLLCEACDLRWFTPSELGGDKYYQEVSETLGYYSLDTWDKRKVLQILKETPPTMVIEPGCGDGSLLKEIVKSGIRAVGTEINLRSIAVGKAAGLSIYLPANVPADIEPDCMISLQSLEHMEDPVDFLKVIFEKFPTITKAYIAVPCAYTMLGHTNDPLVWPPHHFTLWSEKSLIAVLKRVGFNVVKTHYDINNFYCFRHTQRKMEQKRLIGLPRIPDNFIGYFIFHSLRILGVRWAKSRHSILVEATRSHHLASRQS